MEIPVVLEYFYSEDALVAKKNSIDINANDSYVEILNPSHETWKPSVFESDSVRIVFDNVKELWYFSGEKDAGNILNVDNYIKATDTDDMLKLEYYINQSIYDLATDFATDIVQ